MVVENKHAIEILLTFAPDVTHAMPSSLQMSMTVLASPVKMEAFAETWKETSTANAPLPMLESTATYVSIILVIYLCKCSFLSLSVKKTLTLYTVTRGQWYRR